MLRSAQDSASPAEAQDPLADAFKDTLEESEERASAERVQAAEDAVRALLAKAQTPGITSPSPAQVSRAKSLMLDVYAQPALCSASTHIPSQ